MEPNPLQNKNTASAALYDAIEEPTIPDCQATECSALLLVAPYCSLPRTCVAWYEAVEERLVNLSAPYCF